MSQWIRYAVALLALPCSAAVAPGQTARDFHGDPLPAGAFARLGKLRFQHDADGICTALAVLPDGKQLVSAQQSKGRGKATWHLWVCDGRPLFQAEVDNRVVTSIAIAPQGERLALLTDIPEVEDTDQPPIGQAIEIWDIAARKKRETIVLGRRRLSAVLLPDRATVLTVGVVKRTIEIRDARKNTLVRSWEIKDNDIARLTASADGRWLTATALNGPARVWETATGKLVGAAPLSAWTARHQPQAQGWHQAGVTKVAWFDVMAFSLLDGKEELELKAATYDPVTAVAFAPDGQTLFAALTSGAITQWDGATGKEIVDPDRPGASVRSLSLSPAARFVAVGHPRRPAGLRVWEAATGKRIHEEASGDYADHAFAVDGKLAYVTNQQAFVIETPGKTKPRKLDAPTHHQTYALAFSPDGKTLYLNTPDGVNRWDVANGKRLPIPDFLKMWSAHLDFSPDGKSLVIGEQEKMVCIDVATGKTKRVLYDVAAGVKERGSMWGSVQLVSESQLLVRPMYESEMLLLDLPAGRVRHVWKWRCEFSDRKCGLSPSNTGAIAVLPHGQSAVIVPDGGQAVYLKTDNVARRSNVFQLVDLATGGIRCEFDPRQGKSLHVALSPDGRYVATGGRDGTALLWDLYARQPGPAPSFEQCWETLAGGDGPQIHRVLCALVQQPDRTVKFLQTKLSPAGPRAEPAAVRKLIASLASADFRARQPAFAQLKKLHRQAEDELRRVRPQATSLEVRRRIDLLLADCESDTPDQVRVRRALEALEMIQQPAALGFLDSLSRGAADAFPTPEVRAALERIGRHRLGRQ